jgi:hypothetical protein
MSNRRIFEGMSDEEYEVDAFADGSRDQARSDLQKEFVSFEEHFQAETAAIEHALDESLCNSFVPRLFFV